MQHIAVLCIWHVCMCVCCVCMLTYMYAHMLSASLGKGSVWLRRSRGQHWIGWHGTLNPRQASGRSVSGMLCLVDVDVKVFLGIDYSFDPATLSPLSSRRQEGLRRAYNHGHYLLSRPSWKINTLGRPETRDRSL